MTTLGLAARMSSRSFATVSGDWERCRKLVNAKGTVVFDDYPNYGVRPAISGIDRSRWRVRVLDQTDVIPREPTEDDPAKERSFQLVEVKRAPTGAGL